jgi:YgiT-type zinc finger domain-containing protein
MSFCKVCGYEMKWRTIEGKKVPMGCRCDYGEYGEDQFFRDFAVLTRCPKCRDEVYFVRHNRGSVWFDYLGQPWPKHPCFDDDADVGRADGKSGSSSTDSVSRIEDISMRTDLGQRILSVMKDDWLWDLYPEPKFWQLDPAPICGERIEIDFVTDTFQIRGEEIRYWNIELEDCENCGERYFFMEGPSRYLPDTEEWE